MPACVSRPLDVINIIYVALPYHFYIAMNYSGVFLLSAFICIGSYFEVEGGV